jgi:sugar/nucleoside kinase (ribokinase family)
MGSDFSTLPIGRVGDDEPGQRLLDEMAEAGMDLRYVHTLLGEQTLYSICLVYPDGSGGNLTVDDSACARIDPASIRKAEADFGRYAGQGIALAMPEVPLAARAELLALGTQYRFLRVASFTSEEMAQVRDSDILTHVDLMAINIDEAAILAGAAPGQAPLAVVERALSLLREIQPSLKVSITSGAHGSWTWDGETLARVPAHKVEVVGTSGAGDAHLAGILAGLAAGLTLSYAHELGALVAALSVTSPHTINKDIDRQSLKALAGTLHRHRALHLCASVHSLLV